MREFEELKDKVQDLELRLGMLMSHANVPLVLVHDHMYSGEQKQSVHSFVRHMLKSESPGFYQVYLNRHPTDKLTVRVDKFEYGFWNTIGSSEYHPKIQLGPLTEGSVNAICDTIVSGCPYPK